MKAAEVRALKGTVGTRLEQKESKLLEEELSSLSSKISNIERSTRLIMKCAAFDYGQEHTDGAIAFSARLSTHTLYRSQETLVFDEVLTNEGDGYNARTGEFTAPVPGNYLISVTVRAEFQRQVSAEIVYNGKVLGRITAGYRGIEKAVSSITVAVEMKQGDMTFVRHTTQKLGEYHGNGYTTFSVFLFD